MQAVLSISVSDWLTRVLQLMNLTDSRLAQAGNEKLELAMLSFFEQFRKIYIGDQVQKSSKVMSATPNGEKRASRGRIKILYF